MGIGSLRRIAALTVLATVAVLAAGAISAPAQLSLTTTTPTLTVPSTTVRVPSTTSTVTTPTVTSPTVSAPTTEQVVKDPVGTVKQTAPKVTQPVQDTTGTVTKTTGTVTKGVTDTTSKVTGGGSSGGGSTSGGTSGGGSSSGSGLVGSTLDSVGSTVGGLTGSSSGTVGGAVGGATSGLTGTGAGGGLLGGTSGSQTQGGVMTFLGGPGGGAGGPGGTGTGPGGGYFGSGPGGGFGGGTLAAMLAGASALELRAVLEELAGCMPALPPLDRRVLSMRAGFGPGAPLSRTKVADRLGISKAAVRKTERRALNRLQFAAVNTGCAGAMVGPFDPAGIGDLTAQLIYAGAVPVGVKDAVVGGYTSSRGIEARSASPLFDLGGGGDSGPAWAIVLFTVLFSVSIAALTRELRSSF
jgi:hypothetical protein